MLDSPSQVKCWLPCYSFALIVLYRQAVLDVAAQVPQQVISDLLGACRGSSYSPVQQQVTDLIAEGYAAQQVLLQLQSHLLSNDQAAIPDKHLGQVGLSGRGGEGPAACIGPIHGQAGGRGLLHV